MAQTVYFLCAASSIFCAYLLLEHYLKSRTSFLFWCGSAFVCLGIANAILFADLVFIPAFDLVVWRNLFSLAGMGLLLYALIWKSNKT